MKDWTKIRTESNPDIIYHYTNEDGLRGILNNQTLWSTEYSTLDDSEELKIYKEYFIERLENKSDIFYNKDKIRKVLSTFDKEFHDMCEKQNGPKLFITSLCQNIDDKHLWKTFGNYSIGLDYKKLDELRIKEVSEFNYFQSLFEPVVYYKKGDGNTQNKITDSIDNIINYLNVNFCNKQLSLYELLVCLPIVKDYKFRKENEYRLVVVTHRKSNNEMTDKTKVIKSNGQKQYIELFDNQKIILPIKEIILGSSVDFDKEKKWIERLLEEKGLDDTVKISKSSL